MSKKGFLSEEMFEAMGDYPLEYRICHLLLWFCASDGELSEEEIVGIVVYVQPIIEGLELDVDIEDLLAHCIEDIEEDANADLLLETIRIFADFFPDEKLEEMVDAIENIVSLDELSDEEAEFLSQLKDDWGIEKKAKKSDPNKKPVVKKKKKS